MKKTASRAFVNQLLVYTLVMLFFTGSVGFATVWLRHEISLAANRSKNVRARIVEVQRQLDQLAAEIAAEQNPEALIRRNSQWRLGLVPPRQEQVVEYVPAGVLERMLAPGRPEFSESGIRPVILVRSTERIH